MMLLLEEAEEGGVVDLDDSKNVMVCGGRMTINNCLLCPEEEFRKEMGGHGRYVSKLYCRIGVL